MTTLREAAQQLLTAVEDSGHKSDVMKAAEALRAALAQPVPRREWQGLTDDEVLRTLRWDESMAPLIAKGMPTEVLEAAQQEAIERHRAIDAALKEKNT